jgi:hypothetical protein
MNKFLIPLQDYERIYQTIYSVLKSEDANVTHSCLYFAVFGAFILETHYKIRANPVAGVAGYRIGHDEKNVLMFAELIGDKLTATSNGFHCWIEADGWLIDFMAPIFPLLMAVIGHSKPCGRKMMQKRLSLVTTSAASLQSIGDFYCIPDLERTNELMTYFQSKPSNANLAQISANWFKRPPKKMSKEIQIYDGKGKTNQVSLIGEMLDGVW